MLTPLTYSASEARQIRGRFTHGDQDLHCPRCREPLTFGPLVERGNRLYGEIYCEVCHRCLMLQVGEEERLGRERFVPR
jgi:hypothetical protein